MDITPLKSCLMRLKQVRAVYDAEPENGFYRDAIEKEAGMKAPGTALLRMLPETKR
jgi:hypothetical protein